MMSSNSGSSPGWVLIEKLHALSERGVRREGGAVKIVAYRFVSTDFGVVRNVALNILAPDDWVVFVRFEELRNVRGSRINIIEFLLAKYTGEMSLDSHDGSRSDVVAKDPK